MLLLCNFDLTFVLKCDITGYNLTICFMRRQRRREAEEIAVHDSPVHSYYDESVPFQTRITTQKALAQAAVEAVKSKQADKEAEHLELLASHDREKIEAALQEALEG